MNFPIRLKEITLPWAIRGIALIFIFILVGLNIMFLPDQIQRITQGAVWDILIRTSPNGSYGVVDWASKGAIEQGVSMKDIVLNPEADSLGEIGTSVKFMIKSGDAPVHEVTFLRRPYGVSRYTETAPASILRTFMYIEIVFLLLSIFFTVGFSLVAFWRNLDAWLAFLLILLFSHLYILVGPDLDPTFVYIRTILPSAIILFLLLFPNGKLEPHWSWVFVLLPLPSGISTILFFVHILEYNQYTHIIYDRLPNLIAVIVPVVGMVASYRYRHLFKPVEWQHIKWLLIAALLGTVQHYWASFLIFLGVPKKVAYELHLLAILQSSGSAHWTYLALRSLWSASILLLLGIIGYRYHRVFTPMERQQTKWLVLAPILSIGPAITLFTFKVFYESMNLYDKAGTIASYINGLFLLTTAAIILSAVLSLFRFRLQEIDVYIHRALVYSGLTGIFGLLIFASTMLVNYVSTKDPSGKSEQITILVLIAIMFALVFPIRNGLKRLADRYFKPESFDVAETFIEITPEMRSLFTSLRLSAILVTQSVEQLDVSYASIFLKSGTKKLTLIKTVAAGKKLPKPTIDRSTLAKLEKGELVIPENDSSYSLIIPLIIPRNRKPSFVGALMLGPRLSAFGYSTDMRKSLIRFGEEAGKALYIARVGKRK